MTVSTTTRALLGGISRAAPKLNFAEPPARLPTPKEKSRPASRPHRLLDVGGGSGGYLALHRGKHRRMSRILAGVFCSISCFAMSLPAEPQDSSSQAHNSAQQTNATQPPLRALPAPLDGIFPSSEYLGPTPLIGVPDTDPVWPLTEALWDASPTFKKTKIKV